MDDLVAGSTLESAEILARCRDIKEWCPKE
jgi:hypothetical protein